LRFGGNGESGTGCGWRRKEDTEGDGDMGGFGVVIGDLR